MSIVTHGAYLGIKTIYHLTAPASNELTTRVYQVHSNHAVIANTTMIVLITTAKGYNHAKTTITTPHDF
jgi:hypothetical protein